MSRGLRDAWPAAALVLLVCGAVFAPLLGDVAPYYRDLLRTDLPLREYLARALREGRLPQWYPWDGLGLQLIGNAEALFRPQTLLLLALEPLAALKLELVLDPLLGAGGFLLFARRLGLGFPAATVGALAFAFSGYALCLHTNLPYLAPYATAPWLLWAAQGVLRGPRPWRDVGLTALCWALVVLGGDPLLSILMGLALVALVAAEGRWRQGLTLLAAIPLTALLTAVWTLPALALFGESVRQGWVPDGVAMALHLGRVPELLLGGGAPDVEPMLVLRAALDGGGKRWAASLFLGGTVLGLALLGAWSRRAGRVWLGVALLGLWLALGTEGGLHPLAVRLVPLLGSFRYPEKYCALVGLALAIAAAVGTEAATRASRRARLATWALVAALAALGLVATAFVGDARWAPEARSDLLGQWAWGAVDALLFLGTALLCSAATRPALHWGPAVAAALELALAGKDLVWVVPAELLTRTPEFCEAAREAGAARGRLRAIKVTTVPPPFTSPEDGPAWVTATRNQLDPATVASCDLEGLMAPHLSGTPARLWWAANHVPIWRLARLLNAGVAVVDTPMAAGLEVLRAGQWYTLVRTPAPVLPRAFAVAPRWVGSPAEAQAALRDEPEATFARLAFLEGTPPPAFPEASPGAEPVAVVAVAEERVELSVTLSSPRAVVLNDLFAPGWTATIDGAPTPIYRANALVRAVLVPAGAHTVVYRFQTPALGLGAAGSLLGLAGVVGLAAWRPRRPALA